jgi:hypothetical protein
VRQIATRDEVLEILTEQARNGSVTAAAGLAREVRARDREYGQQELDETIDRILGRQEEG